MEHFYTNIDGWFDFQDLYAAVVKQLPQNAHVVEVGCWKGRSTSFLAVEMINTDKNMILDCVDTWAGDAGTGVVADPNGLLRLFLRNMQPVASFITPIQLQSIAASRLYPDNSLDFVFIDAAHDYEQVYHDIKAWLPKVKCDGFIGGHDYRPECGVVKAVNEHFKNPQIVNYSWIVKKGRL